MPLDYQSPPPEPTAMSPRCLRCSYLLQGLRESRCPECGLGFDLSNPRSFTRLPAFVFWKYWLPGLSFSIVGGIGLCAAFLTRDRLGWGLVLGAPFSIGGVLGYAVRAKTRALVILALAAVIAVVTTMFMANLAGVFCGAILAVLFTLPTLAGVLCGCVLRQILKSTQFSQRWYLPVLLLLLPAPALHLLERGLSLEHPAESLSTTYVMDVPLDRAWRSHLFGKDEAPPSPTALMRIGLPKPLDTGADHMPAGRVMTCRFNKGTLTVSITDRVEHRSLGFAFLGQSHIEDRAVRLLDGRFDFESIGPSQTKVTLTTRYQPLMTPRWYWRPMERLSGESVHEFLLDEMSRDAHRPERETQVADGF